MYVSYALSLLSIGLVSLLFWSLTHWPVIKDVIWALILFLPLAPAMTLFARVLWIYLDQTVDPDRAL
jgi:hypothetical protein